MNMTLPPPNASSTAIITATSILASCCIALLTSSWAAYLVGKRHGAFEVSDDAASFGISHHADKHKSSDNRSSNADSERASSNSPSPSPPCPDSEGCPASSSFDASPFPPALHPAVPIHPIGTLQSIYRLCVGTPRQGMLVPHSRGIITFDETFMSQDSVLELKHYSHVYVVFVFHLNSNTHKLLSNGSNTGTMSSAASSKSSANKSRQFPSKITPPSLGGKKVGVFSTRTPHRPNPIGFSLCKLDKVLVSSSSTTTTMQKKNKKMQHPQQRANKTTFSLLLSGLDIVDGTPILDIKPYVPHYDCVGYADNTIVAVHKEEKEVRGDILNRDMKQTSCGAKVIQEFDEDNTICSNTTNNESIVRVPQWVDSGLKKRRSISFLPAAEQFLKDLATSSPSQPLESSSSSPLPLLSKMQFYGPNSPWQDASPSLAVHHIRNVIIEVLTADVRSVWQTAKARRGEFQAERSRRLATSSSDEKKIEAGVKSMMEGTKDHQEMIECCCCTQQIDNLLVHYTIEGPRTTTATTTATTSTSNGSTTSARSTTIDERSMGSGAEDSVVVVSLSLVSENTTR